MKNVSIKELKIPCKSKIRVNIASFAVECYGTQEHHFTADEFQDRYQENFNRP
jgi:hypothetical protein